MSRSGYVDNDPTPLEIGRAQGACLSALRGKRGQQLLKDGIAALETKSRKTLSAVTMDHDDCSCFLREVAKFRGIEAKDLNPWIYAGYETPDEDGDWWMDFDCDEWVENVAHVLNVAPALVREIVSWNDDVGYNDTPQDRWKRMHRWAKRNLAPAKL